MKKIIFAILPIVLVSFFVFKDLFGTYFQQDEWHAFGIILADGWKYVTLNQTPFQLLFGGDRAGARVLNALLFSGFGLNVVPYFSLSLGLHFFNSFLVYKLAYKLLRDKKIAYIALLLFLFNGLSSQAYTWLGAFAGAVPNMTFLLLSLYAYLKFLFEKKKLFLYLSLITLWISFLFKETGFFFLIFYPVIYLIYTKNIYKSLKANILFISYGLFLFALRANEVLSPKGDAANYVTSKSGFGELFLNAISYPLQGFSQLLFPSTTIYSLSEFFSSIFLQSIAILNTTEFTILAHSKVAPLVSILITSFLFYFIYKIIRSKSNGKYIFSIYFCVVFILLSFVPYIVIQRANAYLEPRYYYNGVFAASILLGIIFMMFLRSRKAWIRVIAIFFFLISLYFNLTSIREEINFQKIAGFERKYIIKTIQTEVSSLPSKVVFYVDGDAAGYYGLEELKTPFQSGLGHTLLVTYASNKKISTKFLHEDSLAKTQGEGFLYGILDQNYREIDGRGFGYFTELKKLKEVIDKNNIDIENIYGFYYHSENRYLENISNTIRKEIANL